MNQDCTVIMLDIRNFTDTFSKFCDDNDFFRLIEDVYKTGIVLAEDFTGTDFYINSTGDGFLLILFGENHYLSGYLIAFFLIKYLTPMFENFFEYRRNVKSHKEGDYYFGIGLESGNVRKAEGKTLNTDVVTYLGDVINITARLESITKDHARAPIIFGNEINEKLTFYFFNESYKELMAKAKRARKNEIIKSIHQKMNEINAFFLSSYIYEHRLKGVEKHYPTFRISPALMENDDFSFRNIIDKLPQSMQHLCKKYETLEKII